MKRKPDNVLIIDWIVTVTISILIILVPVAYFFYGFNAATTHVQQQVELKSEMASQLIGRTGGTWIFWGTRLQDLMAQQPELDEYDWIKINQLNGNTITELEQSAPPYISRRVPLYDIGNEVGHLELYHSIRPLLVESLIIFLFLLPFGVLAVYLFKRYVLHRLREADTMLLKSYDTLEKRVQVRTLELEKARAQAEAASIAKSRFLANMSHELRTPLTATIGYSELILEQAKKAGHHTYIPDLKNIKLAGTHLLDLIDNILDISKIEAGKMELLYEDFDLEILIAEIVSVAKPLIKNNNNELEVDYADDIGTIRSDLTKLRQIISNLLSNAAKFTSNGKIQLELILSFDDGMEWLEITVKDTGIGMTAEQQAIIFNLFAQANVNISRNYGGTGLGLTLSKDLCEIMGGTIHANSEPGKGSIFTVRIPVKTKDPVIRAIGT